MDKGPATGRTETGHEDDGLWPRLRRNAGLILGGRLVAAALNLAAAAVAVRAVGLEAFGVVALLQAYVRVIAGLLRFESWAAVTRYGAGLIAAGRGEDLRRLTGLTLRLDLIAFALSILVAWAAAAPVGAWLGWPDEITAMAPLYALSIVFITAATPTGFLRLVDRFAVLAVQTALNAALRLAGALALLAFGGGVEALALVWAGAGVAAGGWMMARAWAEARRRGLTPRFRGGWRTLGAGFPGIWRFVVLTNATATVESVIGHAAVLIVGGMLGTAEASLYAITRQFSEALGRLRRLLGPVIFPETAELAARGARARIRAVMGRVLKVAAALLAVLVAALWFGAEPLLALVFGQEAAAGAPLLILSGAAAGLGAAGFALSPALLSLGAEGAVFRTGLVAALVFLPALVLLLRTAGLEGAGVALLLWQGVLFAGRLAALKRALAETR